MTIVYFTRRQLMNGATVQAFLHEKLPHDFPLYDFPEIKSITKSWEEIRLFIKCLDEDNQIITKAEEVHWDSSTEAIAEEDYISITPDEVFTPLAILTIVTRTDETEYRKFNKTVRGTCEMQLQPQRYRLAIKV